MAIGLVFFDTGRNFLRIPLLVTIKTLFGGKSVVLDCLTAASVIFIGVLEINVDLISPDDAHGTFPLVQNVGFCIDGVAPPFHEPSSSNRLAFQSIGITPASVCLYPGISSIPHPFFSGVRSRGQLGPAL